MTTPDLCESTTGGEPDCSRPVAFVDHGGIRWCEDHAAEVRAKDPRAELRRVVGTVIRRNADDEQIVALALRVLFRKHTARNEDLSEKQWSRAGDILEALAKREPEPQRDLNGETWDDAADEAMSAATLTPADLDAIEARANAATPGPWRRAPSLGIDSEVRAGRHDALTLCAEIHVFPGGGDPRADADFIASSRADVPRLVAALRAAELARATLTRDLREAVSTVDELHNANDGATVDQATARADALLERLGGLIAEPQLTCSLCGQPGHTALSCMDTSDLAGHVAPDAPPSPLTHARNERDRLRALFEQARDDYMRAECHARALESGAR